MDESIRIQGFNVTHITRLNNDSFTTRTRRTMRFERLEYSNCVEDVKTESTRIGRGTPDMWLIHIDACIRLSQSHHEMPT